MAVQTARAVAVLVPAVAEVGRRVAAVAPMPPATVQASLAAAVPWVAVATEASPRVVMTAAAVPQAAAA